MFQSKISVDVKVTKKLNFTIYLSNRRKQTAVAKHLARGSACARRCRILQAALAPPCPALIEGMNGKTYHCGTLLLANNDDQKPMSFYICLFAFFIVNIKTVMLKLNVSINVSCT